VIAARRLPALALALVALAGCKRAPSTQMLLVAGSTTMQRVLTHIVAEFAKREPGINIVNEAGGAAAGIIALKRGAIDVATLSRDLTKDEDDGRIRDYLIARDGLAIILNPANPIANLTVAQLRQIYTQQVTSWKALGGPDAKIEILTRDSTVQVQRSLRDIVLHGAPLPPGREVSSRDEMIEAVKTAPNAIGFVSLRGMDPSVKALTINGVAMTRLTILSGRYPLSRSFYLVLYGLSAPAAEKLVTFARSADGQAILAEDGLIPVR
jgi:phosphate transport system substrate-binding protein